MPIRNILATGALATVAVVSLGSAANASVTETFIGKGDVQTAFGFNNAAMQKAVGDGKGVTFSSKQSARQTLGRDVSQDVTQSATQTVHRTLSCTITTGGDKKPVIFEADGYRDGTKTGTKTGSQSGTQAGSLDGTLATSLATDARKTGQWTGWNITGFASGPTFAADGEASWNQPSFGDPTFNGDFAFGDVEWSGWVSESQHNPADCDRNSDKVSDYVEDVDFGHVVPGDVAPTGDVKAETARVIATEATAPAKVFATINTDTRAIN
jgi:hypothetical protein